MVLLSSLILSHILLFFSSSLQNITCLLVDSNQQTACNIGLINDEIKHFKLIVYKFEHTYIKHNAISQWETEAHNLSNSWVRKQVSSAALRQDCWLFNSSNSSSSPASCIPSDSGANNDQSESSASKKLWSIMHTWIHLFARCVLCTPEIWFCLNFNDCHQFFSIPMQCSTSTRWWLRV